MDNNQNRGLLILTTLQRRVEKACKILFNARPIKSLLACKVNFKRITLKKNQIARAFIDNESNLVILVQKLKQCGFTFRKLYLHSDTNKLLAKICHNFTLKSKRSS